ncbi:MAG: FadR/GntR family transcriptional regulator [Aestuariivirga sp.]
MAVKESESMMRGLLPPPAWTPLPQVVARRIQQMLLDGAFNAGDRIPSQRVLSDQFSVSRASLREALLTLETLGVIKTEPGRGTFVTAGRSETNGGLKWRYSDSFAMAEVFETRVMLEGQIVENAATVIRPDALAALRVATDEMEQFWAAGDRLANVEADLRFHRTIAQCCTNRMLQALYETVHILLAETQRQPIPRTKPSRMHASVAEHRDVIAALATGDGKAARLAMHRHIINTAVCAGINL